MSCGASSPTARSSSSGCWLSFSATSSARSSTSSSAGRRGVFRTSRASPSRTPRKQGDPMHFLLGGGILFFLIALLLSIFWLWMLIDAIISPRTSGVEKLVWVLVIFFTHILGALLYFFLVRRRALI